MVTGESGANGRNVVRHAALVKRHEGESVMTQNPDMVVIIAKD